MKIWTLSDLHIGNAVHSTQAQRVFPSIPDDADVCVMPGDLTDGRIVATMKWLHVHIGKHMPVVYVAGNHDFYHTEINTTLVRGKEAAAEFGIHLLENESVVIAGTRFIGTTLWTDYELYAPGPEQMKDRRRFMMIASAGLNDHNYIDMIDGEKRFTPDDARQLHLNARRYLDKELAQYHDAPTVVVTHHGPHPNSVAEEFEDDTLTPAFCSDLSELIERHQPELWIHGHTHTGFDYEVGSTRIVCNPMGYSHEYPKFDSQKVVDISRYGPKPGR